MFFLAVSKFLWLYISLHGTIQFLTTAADSPVSMASFMTQDPLKRIKSHGIIVSSGITTISPGTRSLLDIVEWNVFPSLSILFTSI